MAPPFSERSCLIMRQRHTDQCICVLWCIKVPYNRWQLDTL